MKLAGKPLHEIADYLGYEDPNHVIRAINEAMRSGAQYLSSQDRNGIIQMELDRLDRLQEKVWPSAMLGDPKSVEAALKIIDRRIKITGIDAVDTQTQQHTVLVIGGREEDYVQKLKELAGE